MTLSRVPYTYGRPVTDEDFKQLVEARGRLFPNSHSYFWGGCHLGSAGGDTEALVCLKCREAENEWSESSGLPTQPAIEGLLLT